MKVNTESLKAKILVAEAFAQKYSAVEGEVEVTSYDRKPQLWQHNAANAAKAFGKEGWVRKLSCGKFDWVRDIDGVVVQIVGAEEFDLDATPVPPALFPIQLEDTASPPAIY